MKAEYIDHMGSDLTVCNAARVSFDKESEWEAILPTGYGTDSHILSKRDEKLIRYLARHNHWTPFSHVMVTMRETMPIFLARQRFKHMIGFTYNEVSRRYVDSEPEYFKPDFWRKRAENKKQGSSDEIVDLSLHSGLDRGYMDEQVRYLLNDAQAVYRRLIEIGVCPEQARMVLPQSMLTSYYVTGSLAAWARAFMLRNDPEQAQREWLPIVEQWDRIIRPLFPVSWDALTSNKGGSDD